MVWSSLSPDGTKSVKANVSPMQQNTTYTETTMNVDHFWNIGGDEDGHHKAINMEEYANVAVGNPDDAPIASGMDGVIYLKEAAGTIQGFFQNAAGIYQFIPAFLSGSKSITSSYATVVSVPDDTFGLIWMFKADNSNTGTFGYFKADGGVCQAYAMSVYLGNSQTLTRQLRFGNGDQASGLNFRARTSDAATGTYQYRIMLWET